jgi:hypothetical protein
MEDWLDIQNMISERRVENCHRVSLFSPNPRVKKELNAAGTLEKTS